MINGTEQSASHAVNCVLTRTATLSLFTVYHNNGFTSKDPRLNIATGRPSSVGCVLIVLLSSIIIKYEEKNSNFGDNFSIHYL